MIKFLLAYIKSKFTLTPLLFFILISLLPSLLLSQTCSIEVNFSLKIPGCIENNGEILVTSIRGGTPPYFYQINDIKNTSGHFKGLKKAVYTLKIQDSNNCKADTVISLFTDPNKKLFNAPSAFSPNNDGVNDTWGIRGVEKFKGVRLAIFNKWGQQLFESPDFSNSFPWDGTQNGDPLPEGTYYYVITVHVDCNEINEKGTITIAR